jgi:uncharacterized protein YndB with AHSA1/START domain
MSSEDPLVEVEGPENRRLVSLRRSFRAPIEELWSALTEPDRVRCWFAPAKIEPRVGGRIELEHYDGSVMMEGMVRVFEPPRVFEYDWVSRHQTSIVRYELEPDGEHTRLTLTEYRLTDAALDRRAPGWHHNVERLDAYLERGAAQMPDLDRWRSLREVYRKRR